MLGQHLLPYLDIVEIARSRDAKATSFSFYPLPGLLHGLLRGMDELLLSAASILINAHLLLIHGPITGGSPAHKAPPNIIKLRCITD